MIKYVTGNLFELIKPETSIVIPHICNDSGGWGAGFVMALSKQWPPTMLKDSPEWKYRQWFDSRDSHFTKYDNPFSLDSVQDVTPTDYIVVANMIAQHGTRSAENPKPIKYAALVQCMIKVADMCRDYREIHAPKFGSGLAGGNWAFIEELIEELWCSRGIPVTIYELPPRISHDASK